MLGARPSVSYSLVQGGWTGTGNLAGDPLFVINDYSLRPGSPAINTGSDEAAAGMITDLESHPRKQGLHVDMGAYEFASVGSTPGPNEPLTIACPENFILYTGEQSCGVTIDFNESYPALVMGGKRPVAVTYTPASPGFFPTGAHTITVTATDSDGTIKTCSFTITVVDTTAPVITSVTTTPSVIYPPNHKMQEVQVNYNLSDNCSDVSTILSVSSNEPAFVNSSGDKGRDWQMVDEHHVRLKADRFGNGTGRIYTITITATDAAGNRANASTTVTVPHDNAPTITIQGNRETGEAINGLNVLAIPNPTSDGFTIKSQSFSMELINILVMDDLGRMVEKRTGLNANGDVYLGSSYRPGIYFVKITQGQTVKTCKIIKQIH